MLKQAETSLQECKACSQKYNADLRINECMLNVPYLGIVLVQLVSNSHLHGCELSIVFQACLVQIVSRTYIEFSPGASVPTEQFCAVLGK